MPSTRSARPPLVPCRPSQWPPASSQRSDGAALRGIGIGAGDVGDQQPADRQPFLDIGKIVGDRGRNVPFGQQPQQPQAGVVVVVAGARAGRKTAGNEMRAAGIVSLIGTSLSLGPLYA